MLNCGTVARRSRDGGIDTPSVSFADRDREKTTEDFSQPLHASPNEKYRFVNVQRRRDKPPPLIVEKWDGPRFYAPFARLGSESSKKSKLAHTTLAPVGKSKR